MVAIKNALMPSCCGKCEFKEDYCFYCNKLQKCIPQSNFFDSRLPDCPLVEIEEHKVGKWIEERDDNGDVTAWHCSNCYDETGFVTTCAWDYCPSCGAEMKGSENE